MERKKQVSCTICFPLKEDGKVKKLYKCLDCNYSIKRSNYLTRHKNAIHSIEGTGRRLPLKTLQCSFFSVCLSDDLAIFILCSSLPALYRPSGIIPSHCGICLLCLQAALLVVMLTLPLCSADLRDGVVSDVLGLLCELRLFASSALVGVADLSLF